MTTRDRDCTTGEIEAYQNMVRFVSEYCFLQDRAVIDRYMDQTRPQADGTLDAILPHFIGIQDMERAKANLNFLRKVGQKIVEIQDLYKAELEKVGAA